MYNLLFVIRFCLLFSVVVFFTTTLHIIQMLCQKTPTVKMFFLSAFCKIGRTLVSVMLSICHTRSPRFDLYKKTHAMRQRLIGGAVIFPILFRY